MGNTAASEHLRKRALKLFIETGDHAGTARVLSNLAITALQKKNRRAARRYIDTALSEAGRTTVLNDDDHAVMHSVEGQLSLEDGDARTALADFQESIDRCIKLHGEMHVMVGGI